ncbi:SDR family NAD(P)-dependent oxidoreductase [Luedemannella helvata]|uniref:SDR family oxidoreductase n=1 Tax=Luedemannella helvata TaxID=349315 RepID=A0ABP4XAT8_9ACTN
MIDEDHPRLAVVTGASSGIGRAAAEEFARRGWSVALVGRDPGRLAEATSGVRAAARGGTVTAYTCDFAVLDEVRGLAGRLRADHPRVDVLANNAGGAVGRRYTTVDGFELTMQTNHLAPFLLSNLLRDRLAGGRMVNTASAAHAAGRLDPADLNGERARFSRFGAYGAAKQANILFALEAAGRWPEIVSAAYHPGVVRTRFGSDSSVVTFFYRWTPFLRTPAQGADTMLWLATEPDTAITSGGYYVNRKLVQPSRRAADPALASALWEASSSAVGL